MRALPRFNILLIAALTGALALGSAAPAHSRLDASPPGEPAGAPHPDANATLQTRWAARVHVYAGTHYATSSYTCGWHAACRSRDTRPERGIDWISTAYPDQAWFNVYAFDPQVTFPVPIAMAWLGERQEDPASECEETVTVSLQDAWGNFQVRIFYVHSELLPGTNGTYFPVYARSLGAGGYWTARHVGNYYASNCFSTGPHIHTSYEGLRPGVINILPRDPYWNCPAPGTKPPGFTFYCHDPGRTITLGRDFQDWAYVAEWGYPE